MHHVIKSSKKGAVIGCQMKNKQTLGHPLQKKNKSRTKNVLRTGRQHQGQLKHLLRNEDKKVKRDLARDCEPLVGQSFSEWPATT